MERWAGRGGKKRGFSRMGAGGGGGTFLGWEMGGTWGGGGGGAFLGWEDRFTRAG